MIEVQIKHAFNDPQPDDVGPDTYVKPKHWNAPEVLANNGAADGDIVTFNPGSSTFAAYRTLVAGSGISVAVNPTNITISTSGSVLTGSGTTGKLPKWSGSNTLTDSIVSESAGLIDIAGTAASYTLRLLDTTNGARLRLDGTGGSQGFVLQTTTVMNIGTITQHPVTFTAFNAEVARFSGHAAGGDLMLKHTSTPVATLDIRGTFTATSSASVRGIYFNGTITSISAASDLFGMDLQPQTVNKFSSGTHANYATLMLRQAASFVGAATITDSAILHITGTPAGGTNNYAVLVDTGSVRVSGVGPHSFGGALDNDVQFFIRGSFTPSNTGTAFGARLAGTQNPTANNDGSVVSIAGQVTKAGSGTHASFQGLLIDAPVIGAGAATLTRASSFKISGAPSGGTQNYALWVVSGSARFQGTGPHSFGGDPLTTSNIQVEVTGAFTAGANQVEGLSIRSTLTPNGSFNGFGAVWSPTIVAGANAVPLAVGLYAKVASTVGAGSITQSSSVYLDPPTGAAATNSSTLYISAAPVNGSSTNYALFVDLGTTRLDGQLTLPTYASHVIGSLTGNTGIGLYLTSTFASGQTFARGLQIDMTMTANADGGNMIGFYVNPVITERAGGTHPILAGVYVAPTITAGAANATEVAGVYVDTIAVATGTTDAAAAILVAPTAATNNYGLLVKTGGVRFSGTGPHAIGTTLDADASLKMGGTFAGSAATEALRINTTLTGVASGNIIGAAVRSTLVEAGSGTHTIEAGIYVGISVTAGAGNATDAAGILIDTFSAASGTTNASGLKVVGPTGSATNTYGIWTTGNLRVDGFILTTAPNVRTTTTYTVGVTDNYIISDQAATLTLTLPTASANTGRGLWVQTRQAQTVVSNASNVVPKTGGAAGTAILAATAGVCALLVSDGTNWIVVASGT